MKKFYALSYRSAVFVLTFCLLFSFQSTAQAIYVVNSTSDLPDQDLLDANCEDAQGNCSLRAAIENANKTPGSDYVHFNLPGDGPHEILLTDDLPVITEPIVLDARTQPGYTLGQSQIMLNGSLLEDRWDSSSNKIPRVVFYLSGNASGSEVSGFTIGGIASTFSVGIYARGTGNHWIYANKIGCTADGSALFPNNGYGMYFQKSHQNIVGDENPDKRNIISGNNIALALDFANDNAILNNFIGTDGTGEHFLGNGDGILTWKNTEEEISSGNPSSGNVIKGNVVVGGYRGLMLHGNENLVEGNRFGTDLTGTKAFSTSGGILLSSGSYNNIGGDSGNLISGNTQGITVYASNNRIANNLIGTDLSGETALPNTIGVVFQTKSESSVCRNNVLENNVISGNTQEAIRILSSYENHLRSNIIGLNRSASTPIPNGRGILLSRSSNNLISKNTVASNRSKGIVVDGFSNQERLTQNSIYGNAEIGIDLGNNGLSENDHRDTDTGPNNMQNFPELVSASYEGSQLNIQFVMPSEPAYSAYPLQIEFFKSDGNRQGKEYISGYQLTEKELPKGKKPISVAFLLPDILLEDGDLLIATATDANGNSSEFGNETPVSLSEGCTPETFYADNDQDGYGDPGQPVEACEAPVGYVSNATDCDDLDAAVFPGAPDDSTDGIDQNCDGVDGPVAACTGSELLQVTETCATATEIFWSITNRGDCSLSGHWELRKASSTGPDSGTFNLTPGESIDLTSGVTDKGKTQLLVYWTDTSGAEFSTSLNASGVECASGAGSLTSLSDSEDLYISPNPVNEEGIHLYFPAPTATSQMHVSAFNASGQLMATQTFLVPSGEGHLKWELDHSSWERGTYILQASLNGRKYKLQFMK